LPLPVAVKTADGRTHRLRLKREPDEQALSMESEARPVRAVIDPDRRFPLYSPGGLHVWGRKVTVTELRWPEAMAWGTNQVRVALRNTDDQPHRVVLHVQTSTRSGGWGWETEYSLQPGEERRIERDFNIKPCRGRYTARLTARDVDDGLLLQQAGTEGEFEPGHNRLAPLQISPGLRELLKPARDEYPALRLLAGTNVFLYYLDGDDWLRQHAPELVTERKRYFHEIRARINPSYAGKVTVLLFPDAESKRMWTGHTGRGWAVGEMIAEVRNARESVDPAHELVHVIGRSLGEPAAVLREGLAVYFQEGQRWNGHHVEAWCKGFAAAGLLWPWERIGALPEIGPTGTQPQITYPQAGAMVKFLIERVGFEKFLAAYRALGAGEARQSKDAARSAFQQHFGIDPPALEREWREALAASDVQAVPEDILREITAGLAPGGN
jgi:hypothetical protein